MPLVIRKHYDTHTKLASIEVGTIQHSPHNWNVRASRQPGVPKYIQSIVMDSPSKIQLAPSKIIASARQKGFTIDDKLSCAIQSKKYRMRCPWGQNVQPASTWGGITCAFDLYKRERIANFNEHSVYLIGLQCDPGANTLVAFLSTENMLINAYRQQFWGLPLFCGRCIVPADTREKWPSPYNYN